jgi:microcystin-dependent protein
LDPTLGQITCFAGSYVPKGFLACDGRTLRMNDYPALGQWLGNTFGGDAASTFGLPNLPPIETLPWGATPGPPMSWIMAAEGTAPNSGSLGLVSEVRPFAQPPDPGGALAQSWLPCDGRVMNIDGSLLLYNLLGNQFGGKFPTTFALPNLPPMEGATNGAGRPVPLQHYICIDGRYPATECDAVNPSDARHFQEGMMASVCRVATFQAPRLCGFAMLQGQELPTSNNQTLWLLLGNLYGGVANKTYVLPNVKESEDQTSYVIVWSGVFPPSP